MAQLDEKTLEHLTRLCRVRCSQEEKNQLLNDLQQIFDYIEQLSDINTDGVEPCNSVLDLTNVFREDLVVEDERLDRDYFLENAPDSDAGFIRVPTVIRKQKGKS